ncbi:MAG: hypothetical protein Homavirus16_10 [Homavirus sp.]|uniref:Uncharacterized protein n=1 Tax=Homavirus sp. TaxID=2487769 RepID=A0A3G5A7M1_9VIRU|nr:MAG: hypothetical protein Homavirus16_10 [Homavirus sp.]
MTDNYNTEVTPTIYHCTCDGPSVGKYICEKCGKITKGNKLHFCTCSDRQLDDVNRCHNCDLPYSTTPLLCTWVAIVGIN